MAVFTTQRYTEAELFIQGITGKSKVPTGLISFFALRLCSIGAAHNITVCNRLSKYSYSVSAVQDVFVPLVKSMSKLPLPLLTEA